MKRHTKEFTKSVLAEADLGLLLAELKARSCVVFQGWMLDISRMTLPRPNDDDKQFVAVIAEAP